MKPFRQYITERLGIEDNPNAYTPPEIAGRRSAADRAFERRQAQRYGGVMARLAAQALAAAEKKRKASPRRDPFPWVPVNKAVPGWWHPKEQWFTFDHGGTHRHFLNEGGNYHVTEVVRNPGRFGVSESELKSALAKQAQYEARMGRTAYDAEGTPFPHDAETVRASILVGGIDISYDVIRLAYMNGWLKVYSGTPTGRNPILEGIRRDSIRAALREIHESGGPFQRVDVTLVGLARDAEQYKRIDPRNWRNA